MERMDGGNLPDTRRLPGRDLKSVLGSRLSAAHGPNDACMTDLTDR